MKISYTVAKTTDPEDSWVETLECAFTKEPLKAVAEVIDFFNRTLRPGEVPRVLVNVLEVEKTLLPNVHHWEKQNLITIIKGGRNYDVVKCRACGATAKRFGLGYHIEIDRKFSGFKFNPCPGFDL